MAAADQLEAFHISALGSAEGEDVVFHKDVERQGVDALLVYYHEGLFGVGATDFVLESDDLSEFFVDKASFRGDEFVSLFCRIVEEARVNFGFFVFEGDERRDLVLCRG